MVAEEVPVATTTARNVQSARTLDRRDFLRGSMLTLLGAAAVGAREARAAEYSVASRRATLVSLAAALAAADGDEFTDQNVDSVVDDVLRNCEACPDFASELDSALAQLQSRGALDPADPQGTARRLQALLREGTQGGDVDRLVYAAEAIDAARGAAVLHRSTLTANLYWSAF